MPIHVRISHTDRLAIAVAHGTITAAEFQEAVKEFAQSGALHYRKIIDVTAANTTVDLERLKALVHFMRAQPDSARRGPLAFVVDGSRGEIVRDLAAISEAGERPIGIFTSLHDARRWLDETSAIAPKR
ncbi:MAG: hypothetical protein ACOY4R_25250 [Pseudomonadota bacterium]